MFITHIIRNKTELLNDKSFIQVSIRQFKVIVHVFSWINQKLSFDTKTVVTKLFVMHVFRNETKLLKNKSLIQMLNR